jgi:hypothetical protein
MKPDDFNKLISDELKRQIPLLIQYDSSIDSKTGIFLGFVFLVFIQVILLGSFVLKLSTAELKIYAVGIVFLFSSIAVGMVAYLKRSYMVGVDVAEVVDSYVGGKELDYERVLRESMLDAAAKVKKLSGRKTIYTYVMASLFSAGIVVLTILALWSIYSMVSA